MTDLSPAEALERAVSKLRLGRQRRHIFLCVAGEKCAPVARSEESWDYLKRRFRELGLVDDQGRSLARREISTDEEKGPADAMQRSAASGHRVRKRHPLGGSTGLAGSPMGFIASDRTAPILSTVGSEPNSIRV